MRQHEFSFRVQLYDVNAFGELSSTGLLRFLQQAASEASAALGYDADWYAEQGTAWLIRRTVVDIDQPAPYREEVTVRTWVSDIRRVRSQREYEVRLSGNGTLIARGHTDWVYVDLNRDKPIQPPVELQALLMPDGIRRGRRSAPRAGEPPEGAFHTQRQVEFNALDSVAHVNNARYAAYLEQDLLDALASHGWEIDPMSRGGRLRPRRYAIEYFDSARYRDRLEGRIWVTEARPRDFACHYWLHRDGQRLLHATTHWEWTEKEMPADLRRALSELAAE
jgi:acyl-CoA thioester hydrolase